jgi:hypothetical protein
MPSIAAEMRKLELKELDDAKKVAERLATSEEIEQALLKNPPENVNPENWKVQAKNLAKNHAALIIAGGALVFSNTDYGVQAFHAALNSMSHDQYMDFAVNAAKALSFTGFALEKTLHAATGFKNAIDDIRRSRDNSFTQSEAYKKFIQDYKINMGPLMTVNHSIQALINIVSAALHPAQALPYLTNAGSRLASTLSIASSTANAVDERKANQQDIDGNSLKRAATMITEITDYIGLKIPRKEHAGFIKYAMASPFVVFLIQDLANKDVPHALTVPLPSIIGYIGLGYFMENKKSAEK